METENSVPVASEEQMITQAPVKNSSSKLLILLILLVIVLTTVIGVTVGYLLGSLKNQAAVSGPVVSPSSSSTTTLTPGSTVNWKTYTKSFFKLSFKYPSDWFVDENVYGLPNIRIQNYDPKTAPGRGFDPVQDKGKYLLGVSKWVGNNPEGKNILTIEDLKSILPKNDDPGFYMGDPVKQILIKNEKEFMINNFSAYYREQIYTDLGNPTESFTYLLDGKGNIISISAGLDVIGGKTQTDQILSTFKFD